MLLHELFSNCGKQVSHCRGFCCSGAHALEAVWASVAVGHGLSSCPSQVLEHRLNSCGTWARLPRGMWDLPRPGVELTSAALAGRFFTTEPLGSLDYLLDSVISCPCENGTVL